MKKCNKCGIEKGLSEFGKRLASPDGLAYTCKGCRKIYSSKNHIEINEYRLGWVKRNPDYNKLRFTTLSRDEKDKKNKKNRLWNRQNRASINKSKARNKKARRLIDPTFRIKESYYRHINKFMKGKKVMRTSKYLGCPFDMLKKHLERKFTKGMNWGNYGLYGWHIDHIIPCASFDLNNPEQQKICFNYKNLQPLWAKDNLSKSAKLPDDPQTSLPL